MNQILFCDHCNESIPQVDLEEGRAGFVEGQVLCDQHFESESGRRVLVGAPARKSRPWGVVALLVLGVGALGFGAGDLLDLNVASLVLEEEAPVESQESRNYRALETRFGAMMDREKLQAEAALSRSEGLQSRMSELLATVHQLEDRIDQNAASRVEGQEQLVAALDVEGRGLAVVTERLGNLEAGVEALKKSIDQKPSVGGTAPPRGRDNSRDSRRDSKEVAQGSRSDKPVRKAEEEEDFNPARDQWIRTLRSKDPGVRFTSLVELTAIGGGKAAQAITGLLKDEDSFLRSYAAHSLGRLGVWKTVGTLIDGLEDADLAVRQAVFEALNQVTGETFGYRADSAAGDRRKATRKWRDWWRDNPTPPE